MEGNKFKVWNFYFFLLIVVPSYSSNQRCLLL